MDLVERCLRAIEYGTESVTARAWRAAIAAGEAGDGAAAARVLGELGERERFAATVLLGVAFPEVRTATALAFDAAVPPGTGVVDWQMTCEYDLVERWAIACDDVAPETLGRLLGRAYYGSGNRALLAVIRDRLRRARIDEAVRLHATMHEMGKDDRGAARAAIGRATNDDAHLLAAIREAEQPPMIQSGGEETEALGAVLDELVGLAADHPAVVTCVQRLLHWGKTYAEKDARSWGVARGAQACVRGGWLDHARALAEVVWNEQLRERCEAAIASGLVEPAAPRERGEEPTIEAIANQTFVDFRIRDATTRALYRLDAGDRDGAFASLLAGIDAAPPADAASAEEKVAWARALAAGGRRDDAIRVLRSVVDDIPRAGCALAVELLGTDARPFVEAALAAHVEQIRFSNHYELIDEGATYLARLVARLDARDLELRLIEAVAVVHQYEDRERSENARWRVRRVTEVLRELANAYPELAGASPTAERLDAWAGALGADRALLGGAAAALANESLKDIERRVGTLRSEHVAPLAAELASRGRLADALAIATPLDPSARQEALVAIAHACTTAKDRQKVVAAFKKCPKSSRDRDAQQMWKHRLGEVLLANDDFDGAIEVLVGMQDCRVSHYGPGPLATRIAKRLDEDPARWTPARVTALLDVLASPHVIPQDMPVPLLAILPTAVVHAPEIALAAAGRIRSKFRQAGDVALVWAALAAGKARAGDRRANESFAGALGDAATGRPFHAAADDFMACVCAAPIDDRDAVWMQAFELAATSEPRTAKGSIARIFRAIDPADAPLAARAIAASALPHEVLDHARDLLGELVADKLDDAALLPLDTAGDPATIRRRVQQAARHLARRGRHAEAQRLAAASGLAG